MAVFKTIQFLPEIFKTDPNKKFLNATTDQLLSEPDLIKINGYIGRKLTPSYKNTDSYVSEPTKQRQDYQLEPSINIKDSTNNNLLFATTYSDIINKISYYGGLTNNHSRLFENEFYSYDPKIDLDKFINYAQYYWLENGPDAVIVSNSDVPLEKTFTVQFDTVSQTYRFDGYGSISNPFISLVRGGTYKFVVNSPGYKFYIQTAPGISGTNSNSPNLTTRAVLGVDNNGVDVGALTFTVPQIDSQVEWTSMPLVGSVEFATALSYRDLQGVSIEDLDFTLGGIDGPSTSLSGKRLIFINNEFSDTEFWSDAPISVQGGVVYQANYDITNFDQDSYPYDPADDVPFGERNDIFQISVLPDAFGVDRVVLQPVIGVNDESKVRVTSGVNNVGKEFYSRRGILNQVPDISSQLDILYYQSDISDSAVGAIQILNVTNDTIDPSIDIIGQKSYVSPNGIIFTNGLKITFDSTVSQLYANKTYYVEGVGESIKLVLVSDLVSPELNNDVSNQDYLTINKSSQDLNAWSRSNRWFHVEVLEKTAQYNNVDLIVDQNVRAQRPIIEFKPNFQLFNFGAVAKAPVDILDDIITNAFSQVQGVLCASTTQLTVTVGDRSVTLTDGDRVIFSQDENLQVRNKIYNFSIEITKDTPLPFVYRAYIEEAADASVATNNTLIVKKGTNGNKQWHFNGNSWVLSQQKTAINQAPKFDVINDDGISFGDQSVYPGSNFTGTKIFSYKEGSGTADSVLGFPLSYKNLFTQGDIQFDNNIELDDFNYILSSGVTNSIPISLGLLQQNLNLTSSIRTNIWSINSYFSKQYQVFTFNYDGSTNLFFVDILPDPEVDVPNTKIVINKRLLSSDKHKYANVVDKLAIIIDPVELTIGDTVFISIYSSTSASKSGFYQIPVNFDINSLNIDLQTLTLGQIRNHLIETSSNTKNVVGAVPGKSNLRDLSYNNFGGSILQHSAPIIYAGLFLNHPVMDFVNALQLASKEYTQFKIKFLELASGLDLDRSNIAASVDTIMSVINNVKNDSFPYHYSDMVPHGDANKVVLPSYIVFDTDIRAYEITNIFNDTVASNKAVYVYVTRQLEGQTITFLLVKGQDYYFDQTRPAVVIQNSYNLLYNDILTIVEYGDTDGSYVPETPTKLGLFPKYVPMKYLDDTYRTPIQVIQGHDGSITPAFNDFRDDLLIELERRIYNNCKIHYDPINFNINDYIPGKWRITDYSLKEYNQLLTKSFLKWVGTNRVDFTTNNVYKSSDAFTWNYKKLRDVVNGENLPGTWRSIYRYFYDTDRPHTHPWEMLGFSEKPDYWEPRYGPAPYTGGNFTLWNDLEIGYIHAGPRAGIDFRYSRPRVIGADGKLARRGLTDIIPVDDNGNLRDPIFLVTDFSSDMGNLSYAIGDIGPTELAWRRSSDFPFAVQLALALGKPAKYFSLLADLQNYFRSTVTSQFINKEFNLHLQPSFINVNGFVNESGEITRSAGYLNWIRDYVKNTGVDDASGLIKENLSSISVQLSYRMAGFSDKKFIELLAEQLSPSSINDSVVVPEENYSIELYTGSPIDKIVYSAVVIERSASGYTVSGYNNNNPFFNIIPSQINNNNYVIEVSGQRGVIYKDATNQRLTIPYGTEFNSKQHIIDFLVSYQRYLETVGFIFTDRDNQLNQIKDWVLSAKEFLHWSVQGWKSGNVLVLSPISDTISVSSQNAVVDEVTQVSGDSRVLDINYQPIKKNNFSVYREDNVFTLKSLKDQVVGLAELNLIQYEHLLLLDNTTVFNDIIYVPETGNRQYRLRLVGAKTGQWNGSLELPGYIYSNKNVDPWQPGQDYLKGSIVSLKLRYYTALENITASDTFQTSKWQQISQDELRAGIVNNFATNASDIIKFYDINDQPLDEKTQLLSNGLIGFRTREYFSNLGIDVTTQSKFYQGLLKQSGTVNAINALKGAQFNNLSTELAFYENWAIRVGEFGALDTNRFIEFILSDNKFKNDPAVFRVVEDSSSIDSDIQTFKSTDVYKLNGTYTPYFLRNENRDQPAELKPLLTAGFVNKDDVDATIYDITNYNDFKSILKDIGVGYVIWVAKDYNNTWNVFRTTSVPGMATILRYSIENSAELILTAEHGLLQGDAIILKNFDSRFDGVYRVDSVTDSKKILITIVENLQQLIQDEEIISKGIVYVLRSSKLNTPTEVVNNTPYNGWLVDDKIWVENLDNQANWGVFNRGDPWLFESKLSLGQSLYTGNDNFGKSVALDTNSLYLYGGAPYSGVGKVSAFTKNIITGSFDAYGFVSSSNSNIQSFGKKIATATVDSSSFLIVSAPESDSSKGAVFVFENQILLQVITSNNPTINDKFGSSLALSDDAKFLYIGAPGANKVFCYTLNYPRATTGQTIVSDGSTTSFTLYNEVTNANSVLVVRILDNSEYLPSIDYTLSNYSNGVNAFSFTGLPRSVIESYNNISASGGSGSNARFSVNYRLTGPGEAELFEIGKTYVIAEVGSTDFTLIGAASNTVGVSFTASGIVPGLTAGLPSSGSYTTGKAFGVFITLSNAGSSYAATNTLTILGTNLGGTSPANDITITLPSATATPAPVKNGKNVVFTTAPVVGTEIIFIQRENYYEFLNTLPLSSESTLGDEFGSSVSCNSDGSTITVGAKNTIVDGIDNSGVVHVYHRTVNEFTTDGLTNTFSTPDPLNSVYRVYLNNSLIYDTVALQYNPLGLNASYFVVDSQTLQYGGFGIPNLAQGNIIKIETNQFIFDQTIYQQEVGLIGSSFGTDLAMCNTGCNIYVASPNYFTASYRFGLVTRFLNVGRVYGEIIGTRLFNTNINVSNILTNFTYKIVNEGNTDFIEIGAPASAEITASISGSVLNVTAIANGQVKLNAYLKTSGILPLTQVLGQLTATNAASASTTATGSSGENNFVVASLTGIVTGQFVSGTNIPSNSYVVNIIPATLTVFISNNLSGPLSASAVNFYTKGLTGTYSISQPQTISSTTVFLQPIAGTIFRATGVGSGTGVVENAVYPGESININNRQVVFSGGSVETVVLDINAAEIPGVTASKESNKLKIVSSVIVAANRLNVVNGNLGSPLRDIGIEIYKYTQSLLHPETVGEIFGTALAVDQANETLVISSDGADIESRMVIDPSLPIVTTFDNNSTTINSLIKDSGAVYIFNIMDNPYQDVDNPNLYAYTQKLSAAVQTGFNFGASIDIKSKNLIVGVSNDGGIVEDGGSLFNYLNENLQSGWNLIRYKQPRVDIGAVGTAYIYNTVTQTIIDFFDYLDPVKGKLLGVVDQELDYKEEYDPASYNQSNRSDTINNRNFYWSNRQVGKAWLDLSTIRFIDYEQESLQYRVKNWGDLFPGSVVSIYEWVESDFLPSQYADSVGDGVPKYPDNSAYTSVTLVDPATGIISQKYYYWVKDKTGVDTVKTQRLLSVKSLENYILYPEDQGIPYLGLLANNAVALYNVTNKLVSDQIAIHFENPIDRATSIIHNEWQLVQQNAGAESIPLRAISKLKDSLAGVDSSGQIVPDPSIRAQNKLGILNYPRQTMVSDRLAALKNYVTLFNEICTRYPILLITTPSKLYLNDPIPTTGFDTQTDSVLNLSYIDTSAFPNGYKILIPNDSTYEGKWVIYNYNSTSDTFELFKVQSYKTDLFWNSKEWYDSTFQNGKDIDYTLGIYSDVQAITPSEGEYIKVLDDGNNKWLLYEVSADGSLNLIGAEAGTIEVSSKIYDVSSGAGYDSAVFDSVAYDPQPTFEFQNIYDSAYQEILINNLSFEFNKLFLNILNYIFAEQKSPDWIFKTSFIDVFHRLRTLEQFPNYIRDNQSFYNDYIQEIKPYRTQIREYVPIYYRQDTTIGNWTDFDLPSAYDNRFGTFRSPDINFTSDSLLFSSNLYSDYANNYKYKITDFILSNIGSGYSLPPNVEITGGGGSGATAITNLFGNGKVQSITITNPGSGYTSTPNIFINGDGVGATAYPLMKNEYYASNPGLSYNLVRSIDTNIKFDRFAYTSNLVSWSANTAYANTIVTVGNIVNDKGNIYVSSGNIVVYNNEAFLAINANVTTQSIFDFTRFTKIDSGNVLLNAIDRITTYYSPNSGMPGKNFELLLDGLSYPGTKIQGPNYRANAFTLTSNIFSFSYEGLTINSGNIAAIDFIKRGFEADKTIKIEANVPFEFQNNGFFTILSVDRDSMSLTGQPVESTYKLYLDNSITATVGSYITQANSLANAYVLQSVTNSNTVDVIYTVPGFTESANLISINGIVQSANVTDVQVGGNIDLTIVYLDQQYIIDSNIYSTYLDTELGTRPEDINIVGGAYIDLYSSHAPEELMPGTLYDALEIRTFSNTVGNTETYGFRVFKPMNQNLVFTRISENATTTLASNLSLADDEILVSDASKLPEPSPMLGNPGIIFINGEKITYYQKYDTAKLATAINWNANTQINVGTLINFDANVYLTIGNVYANANSYVNTANLQLITLNSLRQIRRGVDGTGAANVILSGNLVSDSSLDQLIPNSQIFSTKTINGNLTVTTNVTYKITLDTPITANIGDYLTQFIGNTGNAKVLSSITNGNIIAIDFITGTFQTATNIGTRINLASITSGVTNTTANIVSFVPLGAVFSNGNVRLNSVSVLQSNVWEQFGITLENSSTIGAQFIRAEPSYIP